MFDLPAPPLKASDAIRRARVERSRTMPDTGVSWHRERFRKGRTRAPATALTQIAGGWPWSGV